MRHTRRTVITKVSTGCSAYLHSQWAASSYPGFGSYRCYYSLLLLSTTTLSSTRVYFSSLRFEFTATTLYYYSLLLLSIRLEFTFRVYDSSLLFESILMFGFYCLSSRFEFAVFVCECVSPFFVIQSNSLIFLIQMQSRFYQSNSILILFASVQIQFVSILICSDLIQINFNSFGLSFRSIWFNPIRFWTCLIQMQSDLYQSNSVLILFDSVPIQFCSILICFKSDQIQFWFVWFECSSICINPIQFWFCSIRNQFVFYNPDLI